MAPTDVDQQLHRAADRFRTAFGRPPRFAAVAPGRVNLIGEHTDYNDGFVLPMAIERQTLIVADPRQDARQQSAAGVDPHHARIASTNLPGEAVFPVADDAPTGEPAWSNYVRGVIAGCVQRGLDPGGFDAVVDSTVPTGGGLSSSAALEVATATVVEAMVGTSLPARDKALLCQWAEHEYAGMPCGIMDQFISAMAQENHALLIDCRSHETEPVPLDEADLAVLIVNSNVAHELVGGEYAQRRQQCEAAAAALGVTALRDATMAQLETAKAKLDATTYRRARHVITENQRTLDAVQSMKARNWQAMGELMQQSHVSLRDDFEVSCDELDILVDLALEHEQAGVFGSRMTGGGFGGCTVTLLRTDAVKHVVADLTQRYHAATGITPTAFATRPAAGARALSL